MTKGRQTTIAGWFDKCRVAYVRVSSAQKSKKDEIPGKAIE